MKKKICSNFENLKFFRKIFKNREISKCSKIDYNTFILLKRACDWNEMILCRVLTKKNFGKFFEKFSDFWKPYQIRHFFTKICLCSCYATSAQIWQISKNFQKTETLISDLSNKPSRTIWWPVLKFLSKQNKVDQFVKMMSQHRISLLKSENFLLIFFKKLEL